MVPVPLITNRSGRPSRRRPAVYPAAAGRLRRAQPGVCHPTAEDFFTRSAANPRISLATVYKSLEALVAIGAASRLTAADGTGSARYDALQRRPLSLPLPAYRRVSDLPARFDPDLIAKLDPHLEESLAEQGFRVTGYRLELVGYLRGKPCQGPPCRTSGQALGWNQGMTPLPPASRLWSTPTPISMIPG